jgi:hypothetical protein
MHKATQGPPLQATARLVALYQNRVPVALWRDAEPDEDAVVPIIRAHYERLRVALDIGREANVRTAAPVTAAAACAYLLLERGIAHEDVLRFLSPTEDVDNDDPRESLRRVMRLHAAAPEEHEEYEALGYMLRAWNLWSAGDTRRVAWKPDDGMPIVRGWPVEIPIQVR